MKKRSASLIRKALKKIFHINEVYARCKWSGRSLVNSTKMKKELPARMGGVSQKRSSV